MTGPLSGPPADEADPAGPVIRDRRRIDPLTGQVRHPESPESAAPQRPAGETDPMAEEAAAGDAVERDLATLTGEADAYRADLGDTLTGAVGTGLREPGRLPDGGR